MSEKSLEKAIASQKQAELSLQSLQEELQEVRHAPLCASESVCAAPLAPPESFSAAPPRRNSKSRPRDSDDTPPLPPSLLVPRKDAALRSWPVRARDAVVARDAARDALVMRS